MPKHLAPLLLGLVSIALVAQTPTPPPTPTIEQAANLKGCADLGIGTTRYADQWGWGYTFPSPDGTYVAVGQRMGSHGCYNLTVYQCVDQQSTGQIGCEGIFPPESRDYVFAQEWVSNHELLITRSAEAQIINLPGYLKAHTLRLKRAEKVVGTSPDGAWQIVSTGRDGMPELYRMRPDGTDAQRLTHSLGADHFLGWSVDGQWLIFDYQDGGHSYPYRMRVDGSQLKSLMTQADMGVGRSSWTTIGFSPDSRWILLWTYHTEPTRGVNNTVIYRLGVPDGGLSQLTDPLFTYQFQDWAPDGRALVYRWAYKGNERSFELIDLDRQKNTTFLVGNYAEFKGWTDDKKAALFILHDPVTFAMDWYQVPLDGSVMHKIDAPAS